MLKKFALLLIAVAVAVKAVEPGQINQCKASDCTDCPTYLYLDQPGDADGLGILDSPECTVYDGGFDGWPRSDSGSAIVYHDVSQPDDGCAYILLSPASVTEPGCGFPLGIYRNAICVQNLMGSTYMWQRCCGQTCTDAGYRRSLRGSGWFGGVPDRRSAKDTLHTLSVHNADGSPVAVKEHRPAVYSEDTSKRSLVANVEAPARREIPAVPEPLARRDCDGFTETRRYTTTGAPILFGGQVRGPASVTKEDSTSVSRTTSVSSTVGDPFGIVSATVGFETTEESSTSLSYQLEVPEGQLAEASWTPILSCIEGTFTGCGDAGDQQGSVCTASISSSGQPDGVYNAVIVS